MTYKIQRGLLLAGILFSRSFPVHALVSGAAAKLELGQADMTRACANSVTGAGVYNRALLRLALTSRGIM
jgi:hypothetical protein